MSQLSVRVGRNSSSKAGGGIASVNGSRNNGNGSGSEMESEGGREGNTAARGHEVTEAEIASLRRQMKAATQVGWYIHQQVLLSAGFVVYFCWTNRAFILLYIAAMIQQ